MQRLHYIAALILVAGCGSRGSLTFNLKAPTNPLLTPVGQPELAPAHGFRTGNGTVIGVASAVQGSGQSDNAQLPLGPLVPTMGAEDVYVTALSGGNTIGLARIHDVTIKPGAKAS